MGECVTQTECEQRREYIRQEQKQTDTNVSKLYATVEAQTVSINNLVSVIKWFGGILATIIGGTVLAMVVQLITKGMGV